MPTRHKMTLDKLAVMTKRGFDETVTKRELQDLGRRISTLEGRVGGIGARVEGMDGRLSAVDEKVARGFTAIDEQLVDIRKDVRAMKEDLVQDLQRRVERLEQQVGMAR